MNSLRHILLVEDSPRDAELILHALRSNNLANEVVHLRDGAEALDYLYRRGEFVDRSEDEPALMLLDLKLPKLNGLEVLARMRRYYYEQQARKRGVNAVAAPGNGGSSRRKKADVVNQQGR